MKFNEYPYHSNHFILSIINLQFQSVKAILLISGERLNSKYPRICYLSDYPYIRTMTDSTINLPKTDRQSSPRLDVAVSSSDTRHLSHHGVGYIHHEQVAN